MLLALETRSNSSLFEWRGPTQENWHQHTRLEKGRRKSGRNLVLHAIRKWHFSQSDCTGCYRLLMGQLVNSHCGLLHFQLKSPNMPNPKTRLDPDSPSSGRCCIVTVLSDGKKHIFNWKPFKCRCAFWGNHTFSNIPGKLSKDQLLFMHRKSFSRQGLMGRSSNTDL